MAQVELTAKDKRLVRKHESEGTLSGELVEVSDGASDAVKHLPTPTGVNNEGPNCEPVVRGTSGRCVVGPGVLGVWAVRGLGRSHFLKRVR